MTETKYKSYGFSVTNKELQKKLNALQDDKIFGATINKILKKHFRITD